MVALSASRLVLLAIAVIMVATWSMSLTVLTSADVLVAVLSAQRVASAMMPEALASCTLISLIEFESSSIAAATLAAPEVISVALVDAKRAWRCNSSVTTAMPRENVSSSAAERSTADATFMMSVSKAKATSSSAWRFSAWACSRSMLLRCSTSRKAMALSRNTSTARAIAPISSVRLTPAMVVVRLPVAICVMVPAK